MEPWRWLARRSRKMQVANDSDKNVMNGKDKFVAEIQQKISVGTQHTKHIHRMRDYQLPK